MAKPEEPALVLFCKRPALNQGKQRLAAEIGAEAALSLAELLLNCTLEDAAEWPGPVVISPSDKKDRDWAYGLLPNINRVVPQPEGNLGERIQTVDQHLRQAGHENVIYIGTDAPVLTKQYYQGAREAFSISDVVLGPAQDGGVTLMGSRKRWPDLSGLPWSTQHLRDALVEVCEAAGMKVGCLQQAYDIDTGKNLEQLRDDIKSDSRPARIRLLKWMESFNRGNPETQKTGI